MKYATIIFAVLLAGCSTTKVGVPITNKFPDVPEQLLVTCPELNQLPNDSKLSTVADTVVKNYTQYHECSLKVDGWVEWYNTQKSLWDKFNK